MNRLMGGLRNVRVALMAALLVIPAVQPGSAQTQDRVAPILAQFEATAAQYQKTLGVPGMAIAVVYRDQVVFIKGFGVREVGKSGAVDADTIFQLASVSKPVASTVVAALVGDGLLSWDDPVIKNYPDFRLADPWVTTNVTVRDLFSHRSGLPDHAGDALEDMGYDRAAVLHRLRYQKLASSLRSQYEYTNFGMTAAAVSAANAAKKSWEDVSKERLYARLGMTRTSSKYSEFQASSNHAVGHVVINDVWSAKYSRMPDAQSPAGGVSSSVRDMTQWARMHLAGGKFNGQQIVSAAALGETYAPHIATRAMADPAKDRPEFYGLGWNVSYDQNGLRLSHSGGFGQGAATHVALYPSEQLGIIVLTNGEPLGLPEAIAKAFLDLVFTGKIQREWLPLYREGFRGLMAPNYGAMIDKGVTAAEKSGALPLERYAGTYRNDYAGEIDISVRNSALVLRQGPARREFAVKHFNRDIFTYQPVGENAYGPSGIAFSIGLDGRADTVTIEVINITGEGTFKRVNPK